MTTDIPEPTSVATEASPAPVLLIEEGFVHKRGPRPLRLWQKRYFRLPAENHTYPLHKLRIVYRKNAKKQNAGKEDFEKTNKCLLETLATATVNSTSVLAYFKSEDKDELPQGFINLKQVEDISPSPKIRPFAFTIKTKSRDYVFSSNSQSETDSWISTLKNLSSSDIPDFSDTAAYQFSYSQLVDRKGFASPSAPAQDDEIFSASEAELDSDEIVPKEKVEPAKPELTVEVPSSETPTSESKPAVVKGESTEDNMSPRKSFYNEVLDFFYRKGPEGEIIKEARESTPKSSTVPELVEEPQSESVAVESTVEEKPSEFSQEIAEMVAPISSDPPALETTPAVASSTEAAPADNRPTRSKTFVLPKFEGKMFSKIFKKNNAEQAVPKDENTNAPEDSAKEIAEISSPKEVDVSPKEKALEATIAATVAENFVGEVTEPEVEAPSNEENLVEVASEPDVIALVGAEEPVAVVPEVVASEEIVPAEVAAVTEETVLPNQGSNVTVEAATDSGPEPVVTTQVKDEDEDNRPFLTRLLSGKRKSKAIDALIISEETPVNGLTESSTKEVSTKEISTLADEPAVPVQDEVISAEVIPETVASQEEIKVESPKQPFIKRLLSGNFNTKSQPIVPVAEQASEVTESAEPDVVSEVITDPIVAESEVVSEPVVVDEVVEEPSSVPVVENKPEVEASDKKDDVPAPQRQASLMARIGELAYSAVVPTTTAIPEETEEEICEHYSDKIKEAVHSGFLYKQSYLLHTNNLRFFILGQDGVLTYYRSAKVASEGKKFAINDTTEVSAVEELLLHLKSANGSIAYFQAKTKEDRDAWFKALSAFAKPVPAEAVVENPDVNAATEATDPASEATAADSVPAVVSETA